MSFAESDIIRQIGGLLSRSLDYNEGLRRAAGAIACLLDADACHLLIYDPATAELVLQATYGLEQDAVREIRLSVDDGIVGRSFRTLEVINTENMRKDPDYMPFDSVRAGEYNSLLAVPMFIASQRVGVLALSMRSPCLFPPVAVGIARSIAASLAEIILEISRAEPVAFHAAAERIKGAGSVFWGIPVTDGVVHGSACLLAGCEALENAIPEHVADPAAELARFHAAVKIAKAEIRRLEKEASVILAEADAAIFRVHHMMLEDPLLVSRVEAALALGFSLPFSLKKVLLEVEEQLGGGGALENHDSLLDFKDVLFQVWQAALELDRPAREGREVAAAPADLRPIYVAHEFLPSQLVRLHLSGLGGIICEEGGGNSHLSILAKALHIPLLLGVKGVLAAVRNHDDILLDCAGGLCILNPPLAEIEKHRHAIDAFRCQRMEDPLPGGRLQTRDGVALHLNGNISLVNELSRLKQQGATGIGLYRTEFMFMVRRSCPTEEEQYAVLRKIVEKGGPGGATVRLLDVGGDKRPSFMELGGEENPAMGLRGLRFLLANPRYFEPHLRAVLRAAAHGRLNLLLPMVADLDDVLAAKERIERTLAVLEKGGLRLRENLKLGIMLEVPSAFFCLADMLPHIDFVSIGTNDLVQYLFAADRGNSQVKNWYREFHPAILRIIRDTGLMVGEFPGKWVSVCGEMAANPLATPLLIGASIRHLSMNLRAISKVRTTVEQMAAADCAVLLDSAISQQNETAVLELATAFAAEQCRICRPVNF